MMSGLLKLMRAIEGISRGLQWTAAILTVLLVLLTVQQVVARYFFQSSSIALQELQWHFFGFILLFAGAATLAKDDHVRVDVLYSKLSHRNKAWINLFGVIFFMLPCCWILIRTGWSDVLQTRGFAQDLWGHEASPADSNWMADIKAWFLTGESSPDPGGLSARWIVKSFLPLASMLLFAQALVLALQSLQVLITTRSR